MKLKKNRKTAFSLTELTLILFTGGILLLLTMSALKAGAGQGVTAVCQSNLGKIAAAQKMYAAENDGGMAPNIHMLNTYLGFKPYDIPAETGCPAVPPEQKRKVFYGAEYGKNAHILTKRSFISPGGNPDELRNSISLYPALDKTMIYMDFPPEPNGGLCAVWSGSFNTKEKEKQACRHEGKLNTVFLDAHTESYGPEDLPKDNDFWGIKN
jgi:prepilin-type processing-associated H-X9-DG protein